MGGRGVPACTCAASLVSHDEKKALVQRDVQGLVVTLSWTQGERPMAGIDLVQANIFAPQDLLLILLIALFFFGGQKLPEIARGLGQGLREFKRASEGIDEDTPAAPTQPEGSHHEVAGPGDQNAPAGLPHD